jgi:CheY-like chemotaxis protein/HPt (histidine-containing phosphotransfer) domain-containing protein
MTNKEKLANIPGLSLGNRLENMADQRVDKYIQELQAFLDSYSAKEAELKAALEKKDLPAVASCVTTFINSLTSIGATELADECTNHMGNIKGSPIELVTENVNFLLTTLTTMHTNVQKALAGSGAAGGGATGGGEKKVICAVDDMPEILPTITGMLQDHYKVIGVTNYGGVIKVLHKQTPDLFLLDIDIPATFIPGREVMINNGYDIAAELRSMPQFAKTPIIFLTSNKTKESIITAVKSGGNDYLVKPVSRDILVEKIGRYLK